MYLGTYTWIHTYIHGKLLTESKHTYVQHYNVPYGGLISRMEVGRIKVSWIIFKVYTVQTTIMFSWEKFQGLMHDSIIKLWKFAVSGQLTCLLFYVFLNSFIRRCINSKPNKSDTMFHSRWILPSWLRFLNSYIMLFFFL